MEVSHDEKPDTAADSKSAPVDNSGTDAVAAVTDTNSVDMKTEEGWPLCFCSVNWNVDCSHWY